MSDAGALDFAAARLGDRGLLSASNTVGPDRPPTTCLVPRVKACYETFGPGG